MMNLKILLVLLSLLVTQALFAQTGETCADPFSIPTSPYNGEDFAFDSIPTVEAGWCGTYNNVSATTDVGTVNFNPVGLTCPPHENEVWFQFTPTSTFDLSITVTGVADGTTPAMQMPRIAVVRGSCQFGLEPMACTQAGIGGNSTTIDIPANSLIPNLPHYIIISDYSATAASNEGAFELCLKEKVEITVPPTGGTYTTCSGIIYDTGGPDGDYSSNEEYSINICPTDSFSCLRLNLNYDLGPFNSSNLDEINIYGFVPGIDTQVLVSTLTGVNENLVILSTGCVRVDFKSNASTEEDGFKIEWACSQEECYSSESVTSVKANIAVAKDSVCVGECTTVSVNPTDISDTSIGYTVEEIEYAPFPYVTENIVPFPGGDTVNDDRFSKVLNIPFDFEFYGNSFNKCIISANGVLKFNLGKATERCGYRFFENLPSAADVTGNGTSKLINSIMFPWHDINPHHAASNGNIFWGVYGEAPFRVFVVSMNNTKMFGSDISGTQQVVLYETSNIIETFIGNKPTTSWNDGRAIHAIQNAAGNNAVVVPNRNLRDDNGDYNNWTTNNDGQRFTPISAENSIPTTVVWHNGEGVQLGTGNALNACTETTEVYHAQITYTPETGDDIVITDSIQITVKQDSLFDYTVIDDAILCQGESINIGGPATPNVIYAWTPAGTLDDAAASNPLASPTQTTSYILNAHDSACSIIDTVTLSLVQDPTPTITGATQICEGVPSTLHASTGYQSYLWSTGETTPSINISTIGNYTVTVTVTASCTGSATVSVVAADPLSASVTSTTPNACSTPNGSINVEVTNGTAPFTYNWSGVAAGQGQNPVELPTGAYTVTITDAGGCSSVLSTEVTQQPSVAISVDKDTVCISDLIQLNATGGSGTYVWTSNNGAVSNANIANPTANPTSTTTYYCRSENNGTVNLITNGGFENGNTGFLSEHSLGNNGTSDTLENAGTYGIYTNSNIGNSSFNSCTPHGGSNNMLVVNGSVIPNLKVWCQKVQVIPNQDYNLGAWFASVTDLQPAQIQFKIDGNLVGSPTTLSSTPCDWQYLNTVWNSGSNTEVELCIVNMKDNALNGNDFAVDNISFTTYCENTDSITVYVSEPTVAVTNSTNDFCGSSKGTITVGASGGFGTYAYAWSDGQTTPTATSLTGNASYSATVTDAYGCRDSIFAYITDQNTIPVNISGNLEVCPENPTTTLTAGNITYDSYTWNTGANTSSISVGIGTHSVTVTDGTCTGTATVNVVLAASTTPPTITGDMNICNEPSTILDAGGGYASYAWSNGTTEQTVSITETGAYTVTVTNTAGCVATAVANVSIGTLPVSIVGNTTICLGDTANIVANTQGAVTWTDSQGTVINNGAALAVTPAAVGTYTYNYKAIDNACETTGAVTITVITAPTLSVPPSQSICIGTPVNLTATTNASAVSWAPANEFTNPTALTQSISPNGTTTYTVTVGNGGCIASETVTVYVDQKPVYATSDDVTICKGEIYNIGVINDANTSYSWTASTADANISDASVGNPVANPQATTTYTLTASRGLCTETDQVTITVENLNPIPAATAEPTEITLGESSTLTANNIPEGSTVAWTTNNGQTAPANGASVSVSPTETTEYTATITTPNQCVYTATVTVKVSKFDFEIPNAFTPNNDGDNDLFYPVNGNANHTVTEFKVFDRWGELVHNNTGTGWDGKHNGKMLPADIYIYYVKITSANGTVRTEKGDVALIR